MTERQIENINKKIKSYKSILSAEKRKFGGYFDNQALRYEIAMLYAKIKDFKAAKRYYSWFEKEFPDDICFPEFHLAWSVAMFQTNDREKAIKKLYAAAFAGSAVLKSLNNEQMKQLIPTDSFEKGFEKSVEFCSNIITPDYMEWLKEFTKTIQFKSALNKYKKFNKQIMNEAVGKNRNRLINEQYKFVKLMTT